MTVDEQLDYLAKGAVDLIYMLKKTFGLGGDVQAFSELHTVGDVVEHILQAVAKKG